MLFSDATDYWFENKVKVFNKYKTIVTYNGVKNKYLIPYFNGYLIN